MLTDPSAPVPLSGKALEVADRQSLAIKPIGHRTKFGCITESEKAGRHAMMDSDLRS